MWTTRLNVKKCYVLLTKRIWATCFIFISIEIALYGTEGLVFVTETECVYCAVRSEYLNLFWANFRILGRAMDYAVTGRRLTAESQVRSQVSPSEIYGGQCATGTGFSLRVLCFLQSGSFHQCSILIYEYCYYQKDKWAKPGNLHTNECLYGWMIRDWWRSTMFTEDIRCVSQFQYQIVM